MQTAAVARPVVCTTTLEAPSVLLIEGGEQASPVEVTRCARVQSTAALMEERFYTWTAPFASGVNIRHQLADIYGFAVAGPDGERWMGFGFPDQTIVWDGSAVENTYRMLLENQSDPIPWRTVDIPNGFSGSIAEDMASPVPDRVQELEVFSPVRALW
ncbi:hypothetical protein [Synechococcus sp. BIOS-E4-1]|uniref:hypothetical protein n=1 Tax=Synechococcus sp. BIOS-E4-1 TaxID=1400864 RepID=UPI00210509AA|nr:hypothetical protein [Synechococcus sp. BIOS-E4-1]